MRGCAVTVKHFGCYGISFKIMLLTCIKLVKLDFDTKLNYYNFIIVRNSLSINKNKIN